MYDNLDFSPTLEFIDMRRLNYGCYVAVRNIPCRKSNILISTIVKLVKSISLRTRSTNAL